MKQKQKIKIKKGKFSVQNNLIIVELQLLYQPLLSDESRQESPSNSSSPIAHWENAMNNAGSSGQNWKDAAGGSSNIWSNSNVPLNSSYYRSEEEAESLYASSTNQSSRGIFNNEVPMMYHHNQGLNSGRSRMQSPNDIAMSMSQLQISQNQNQFYRVTHLIY